MPSSPSQKNRRTAFPPSFTWGAAAAAYQIEGAAFADGKGLSVWDTLCRQPGKIWMNHSGETACLHYKHYREDICLMKEIGLQAYRFSFCWPRVLPSGTGPVNQAGIDFYDRLIDCLLEMGIEPWATVYHWDFPYDLYCRGGWLNPDSPRWFEEYTRLLAEKFSDRITNWITLNEPQCFIGLGHRDGQQAPGDRLGMSELLTAAHHVLLAHGHSAATLRSVAKRKLSIGWAPAGMCFIPETDSSNDIEAARAAMFDTEADPIWGNAWWADPPLLGHYPEAGVKKYARWMPKVTDEDLRIIRQPLDFYGVNIYGAEVIRAGHDGQPERVPRPAGHPHTHFLWNVEPSSLYWGPRFLSERYHRPIVITENGMSNVEWISVDGKVHDPQRIDFFTRYLSELSRAIHDGVDVRGYFVWSILDNFEWSEGYKHRFGLIYVDYPTQRRIKKDSADWYRRVIETNGALLPPHEADAPASTAVPHLAFAASHTS